MRHLEIDVNTLEAMVTPHNRQYRQWHNKIDYCIGHDPKMYTFLVTILRSWSNPNETTCGLDSNFNSKLGPTNPSHNKTYYVKFIL